MLQSPFSPSLPPPAIQCIWRLTRCIPTLLPSLNVDQLLLDVHRFYEGHAGLNSSFESKPCRTAKTILFHLASNMGQKVRIGSGEESSLMTCGFR